MRILCVIKPCGQMLNVSITTAVAVVMAVVVAMVVAVMAVAPTEVQDRAEETLFWKKKNILGLYGNQK